MSDNDLRDRIAKAIMTPLTDRMGFVDGADDGSEVVQVDGFVDPREIAQAVIDDLGLTVATSMVSHHVHDDGTWTTYPSQSRIVSKWGQV